MADHTKIEWTEATWNPITGCSVTSPGCTNCYAMKLAGTRLRHHESRAGLTQDTKAGPVWTGEVRFNEQWLDQPLRWKRPRMIFVCAHGDLFHESVPDEWIDRVFAVMALCPQHTFQVLTKRSARMRKYFANSGTAGRIARAIIDGAIVEPKRLSIEPWPVRSLGDIDEPSDIDVALPLPNAWLGVSVEDQQRADERIPDLLATPAAVRWLSCEPLLGAVDLELDDLGDPLNGPVSRIDWIVAGGESGPGARPMHPDWARQIRDQCAQAGVPFFFKQWGEWHPSDQHTDCDMKSIMAFREDGSQEWRPSEAWGWSIPSRPGWQGMCQLGKKRSGRVLDDQLHDAMPEHAA